MNRFKLIKYTDFLLLLSFLMLIFSKFYILTLLPEIPETTMGDIPLEFKNIVEYIRLSLIFDIYVVTYTCIFRKRLIK